MEFTKKKGGSNASEYVMDSTSSCCSGPLSNNVSSSTKYPQAVEYNISAKDIVKNYGSIYQTTGGGNLVDVESVKEFAESLVSNRVLDLYLKYMGITTLTTTTLVPLALIMGKDYFEDAVNYIRKSEQTGGKFLSNKIPVLDDPLIGNYLKIAGLTAVNVSPATLVPLGILMMVYNMYQEQSGGRVLMPMKYFDPNHVGNYVEQIPPHEQYASAPYAPKMTNFKGSPPNCPPGCNNQSGGGRYITGQTIPPNAVQNIGAAMDGREMVSPTRFLPYYNNDMQLRSPDVNNFNTSKGLIQPQNVAVQGFSEFGIKDSVGVNTMGPVATTTSSQSSQSNDTHSSNPINNEIPGYDRHPPTSPNVFDLGVPDTMAGGGSQTDSVDEFFKNLIGGDSDSDSENNFFFESLEGGASDWRASQMSRGAYNSPGQDVNEFRMFTKTGDYISNKNLSIGAADHWSESVGTYYTPLYQQNPGNEPPQGYNISGVPTSQFGGESNCANNDCCFEKCSSEGCCTASRPSQAEGTDPAKVSANCEKSYYSSVEEACETTSDKDYCLESLKSLKGVKNPTCAQLSKYETKSDTQSGGGKTNCADDHCCFARCAIDGSCVSRAPSGQSKHNIAPVKCDLSDDKGTMAVYKSVEHACSDDMAAGAGGKERCLEYYDESKGGHKIDESKGGVTCCQLNIQEGAEPPTVSYDEDPRTAAFRQEDAERAAAAAQAAQRKAELEGAIGGGSTSESESLVSSDWSESQCSIPASVEMSQKQMVYGMDGSMGPNDLNLEPRAGYADVETSSFENRTGM